MRGLAAVDGFLGDGDDGEGADHEEQAGTDLSQWSELDDLFNGGVKDKGEERDEDENQEGIDGLDLGGEELSSEEITVHVLCLEDETGGGLVEEAPEHADEKHEGG